MRRLVRSLTTVCFVLAIAALATTADAGNKGKNKGKGHAKGDRPRVDRPMPAIPEPTAALAFGAGLLAIGAATRRREQT